MAVDTHLDVIDRQLLNLAQSAFPLTAEPYADLGAPLGLAGVEVIRRMAEFCQKGLVRQMGPMAYVRAREARATYGGN